MSSVVEKLAAEGHLTPEQVERIGRNTADLVKAAKADPALMAQLQKLAGIAGAPAPAAGGLFSHLGWKQTAGTLLAAAGIQVAGNVIGDAYRGIKDSIDKARNYKSMLDQNPQLGEMDSKQVQRSFDTLHKFNPAYASDPSVAGQFVKDTMEMERMPIEQINSLVRARSDMASSQAKRPGFNVGNLPITAFNQGGGAREAGPGQTQEQIDAMHGARMTTEQNRAGAEDARRRNLLGLP